jgi:hypothetical protein
MKKIFLAGLLLVCSLDCRSATLIGVADADVNDGAVGGCGVSYPQTGFFGLNILYPGFTSFQSFGITSSYELAANHAVAATVTLNMTLLSGTVWEFGTSDWLVTTYDDMTGEQTFSAPNVVGESESSMFFSGNGRARLDLFECGAATPTRSKTITWYESDAGTDAAGDRVFDGAAIAGEGGTSG